MLVNERHFRDKPFAYDDGRWDTLVRDRDFAKRENREN